jgi:hypothetical protein
MTFVLIQTRIDFSIVQLLRSITDTLEHQWLGLSLWAHTQDIEHDLRCRLVVILSGDISVTNDKDESALVIVVENREGVDGPLQRLLTLGITGDLANDEFVECFWVSLGSELQSGQDCSSALPRSLREKWYAHLAKMVVIRRIENARSNQF